MSDLLRDVDDMMRQERLIAIWRRYGNLIIGGVIAVILAVAAQQGYQAWFKAQAEKKTQLLIAAQDDPVALAKLATEQSGNSAAMANILAAQRYVEDQKNTEAAALYLAARNDAGASKDLRELAALLWVRVAAVDEKIRPEDLQAVLAPLMRDDGQPFAWSARLESAVIAAHRQNDLAGAIERLAPMLNHPALPFTLSERARALTRVYQVRLQQAASKKG